MVDHWFDRPEVVLRGSLHASRGRRDQQVWGFAEAAKSIGMGRSLATRREREGTESKWGADSVERHNLIVTSIRQGARWCRSGCG
jgi:hypothetical protein